ncbi:hypothetical protein [Microbacterium testaceum]|uniref:Uncharacterized protein n=1 Tax=Microbacterium testaceum TaxID=2033 RepID=A0A147F5S3_MICTE|nr:hypothetical protein [Microbacterium testaceum]KTS09913.1 hypothetical protein RSA3_12300 [Microbacterium testaceum]
MTEPDWAVTVHDTKSGDYLARISPTDSSWSTSLAGSGESTETIVLNDAETPWTPETVASLFQPHNRMLVRWWGTHGGGHPEDLPILGHKIESDDYNRDKGTLTISAIDLIKETNWRLVDGVGADKHSTLTITNKSPSGAVRAVLARMMQWGPDWEYPIDLPPDGEGDVSGSWPFWKGYTIAEILKEIQDRTGVEIYLRIYAREDGGIRFQTLVGNPITTGSAHFNIDAAETPLSGVTYTLTGRQQITGLQGIGNGTGEDQETRASKDTITIPIRDTKKSFDDLAGEPLQQATDTHYRENVDPTAQWNVGAFTISGDDSPAVVMPGSVLELEVHGDPRISDGVHVVRSLRVSGGNGRQVKPEVQ